MGSRATGFAKALSTSSTASSFTTKTPTGTEPTGNAIISFTQSLKMPTYLEFLPYGLGDDNDEFSMRVWAWRQFRASNLWIPKLLCEVACVMCASTGVAGTDVVATERFVDAITLVFGNDGENIRRLSPGSDLIASLLVDVQGAQKIELDFDMTTGAPTNANALYAAVY